MFPATVWMDAAISSIEVDVSSAAWAWLCAPWVMSFALVEICPAEDATCTDVSWMLSTIRRRFATMLVEAVGQRAELVVGLRRPGSP